MSADLFEKLRQAQQALADKRGEVKTAAKDFDNDPSVEAARATWDAAVKRLRLNELREEEYFAEMAVRDVKAAIQKAVDEIAPKERGG